MNKERLDKIISNQFCVSRKDARIGIRKRKATVNGQVIKDPSAVFDIDSEIMFDGEKLEYKKFIYILMNKPKGVISASNDKSKKTVVDLVPQQLKRNGLSPVGRLDKDTTGLLLITDDGEFAHKAISPKNEVYKTYIATLDGQVTDKMVEIFAQGVVLADGSVCRKAELKPLSNNRAMIKICEGKYHQIKRMFGTVGLGVCELERTAFGGIELPDNLPQGECVELDSKIISSVLAKC